MVILINKNQFLYYVLGNKIIQQIDEILFDNIINQYTKKNKYQNYKTTGLLGLESKTCQV